MCYVYYSLRYSYKSTSARLFYDLYLENNVNQWSVTSYYIAQLNRVYYDTIKNTVWWLACCKDVMIIHWTATPVCTWDSAVAAATAELPTISWYSACGNNACNDQSLQKYRRREETGGRNFIDIIWIIPHPPSLSLWAHLLFLRSLKHSFLHPLPPSTT